MTPGWRHVTALSWYVVFLSLALSADELEWRRGTEVGTTASGASPDSVPSLANRGNIRGVGTENPGNEDLNRREALLESPTSRDGPDRDHVASDPKSPARSRDTSPTETAGETSERTSGGRRRSDHVSVTSRADADATSPPSNQPLGGEATGSRQTEAVSSPEAKYPSSSGSVLPRRGRHLGNSVHNLVTDERNPSGYGDHHEQKDDVDNDVTLPEDDDVLRALLSIAKCRAICPNQCWWSCADVYNNRSHCKTLPGHGNQDLVNNTISLPCTLYERLPSHRLPVCPDYQRRHLVHLVVTYTPLPPTLVITWSVTMTTRRSDDYAPIVVAFWRDKIQKTWYYLNMYRTQDMFIPVEESVENFGDLNFLLVAVSPSCILDTEVIKLPDSVLRSRNVTRYHVSADDVIPVSAPAGHVMADDGDVELSPDQRAPFSFRLAADVTQQPDGRLYVIVTWIVPDWLGGGGGGGGGVKQTIFWARQSCRPPTGYTSCGDDSKLHTFIMTGTRGGLEKNELVLTAHSNMTYNSVYWVVVKLNDNMYRSKRYNFSTLTCDQPTAAFTKCLPKPACSQNDSCGAKSATDFLSWEINLTCWQRDREPGRREVKVHLTWSEPPTEATITGYTMLCEGATGNNRIQRLTERSTQVYLQLDTLYQIRILARLSGAEGPTLVRAQPVYINTSQDSLHEMWPQCENLRPAGSGSPLVISLAVAGGFIMAIVTISVIYKKRDSFREIIIDKATVVKSNSYKSTLGAYSDLRDHKNLLSDNDSWEIDPQQVALGSELGHGAFGRVLVGHYKDEKVAIKILKDGAPFFQRDDLLREIHIMQTLGSHPNIVSFVGACTAREPIALIMEYMPYGNLQQFLKRFRAEGELYRSSDGYRLLYNSVEQFGCEERWSLVPNDFLSYARQIAMAMEYLSDRQYVHRDLAARNVLVGYNKTVKLCDFGLARLVYSNDQYYRLTGGRLPIRWMALESLRDRIYTSKSDVWAYGILLWELVTLGCCPYPNVSLGELLNKLTEGYRMEQPSNCSDELYDLMCQCWCENPADRPTFTHLRLQLELLLSRNINYLALDNLDLSCDSSEMSDDSAPFDVSMESLVTDQELAVAAGRASGSRTDSLRSASLACIGADPDERLRERLIEHSPGGATGGAARRGGGGGAKRTLSTWSVDGDELKHWLRMHALTKSTLSVADLQAGYSPFSRPDRPAMTGYTLGGSTNSELHTVSTIL